MQSATNINKEVVMQDEKMLLGKINADGFQQAEYKDWFNNTYTGYSLKPDVIEHLKDKLNGIQVKVFIGTWCSDSQREVPAFYKILDALEFDQQNLTMIGVDRSKEQPEEELQAFEIEYVPTFIFYRNGEEIGRIIETPTLSLEEDILSILSK
ncbi:MAG: thioredoxin family protein [Bacteroidia bacterium]|nr:thioredoxin family protein [Bacteroidia bacterium]